MNKKLKKYTYIIDGLDCANCARKIEDAIKKDSNYSDVNLNFSTSKLTFSTIEEFPKIKITKIVNKIEPDAVVLDQQIEQNDFTFDKENLTRIIIGILIGMTSIFINYHHIKTILIITSYIFLLPKTLMKAIKILIRNKSLDEHMLITISVIGAFLIGKGFEGFMVIALYEIGKLLEEAAVNKSKKSVSELMNIKVEYANVKENGSIIEKDPKYVQIGDIIVIKKGEKIPLDGTIIKGETLLDMKALTGESALQKVNINDKVLSGSINTENIIEVKVEELYENSTVNRILNLVEKATDRKAKSENFVAKAAKIYTPIVLILAIIFGIFLPILTNITYEEGIYRALSFLVISCPCAIAISVPLSYFSGIGIASKYGILIKGSDYLDNLRKINTIIFDKTGTLTTGEFEVLDIKVLSSDYTKEELIEISAIGESLSLHPIAKSIVNYYGKKINNKKVKNYKEISGQGIKFDLNNKSIKIGNSKLTSNKENNHINIVINNELVGYIIISDGIKSSSKQAIKALQKTNTNILVFTGDNEKTTEAVCNELNIKEYYYKLLPTDKYNKLEELLKKKKNNEIIAFVGDGINDAPVLMRADIGISMGSLGSSSAIEASDIVLMNDDINNINKAIEISNKTTIIIKENLIFALGTKLLFIILNMFGSLPMALAVFADVGVTVIAILNSIRILKIK